MIITDNSAVQKALDDILDNKEGYITVDRKDIIRLFGEHPKLRMIQVAANTVEDIIALLKQDIAEIGGFPQKYFAAYISMDLKMTDLELLGSITDNEPNLQRMKRTVIFEKSPLGDILLLYFFD